MNKQTQSTSPPLKKMGRPKSSRTGKHYWIPAELVPAVDSMLEGRRQRKQKEDSK